MTYRTNLLASALLVVTLGISLPAIAQDVEIDFGDDSSTWANDGSCDDPRFSGDGVALFTSPLDAARDATDCQAAYEAGTALYIEAEPETPDAASVAPSDEEIDFGDDSGSWANDDECDDPRFGGTLDSHEMADATDCRTAYEAGEVDYTPAPAFDGEIDFGDDSGSFANDDECDDPRFGGALSSHLLADATDCRAAYDAGEVSFVPPTTDTTDVDSIDFGDDSGDYANDGECDDARFEGTGMGASLDSHILADATDCRTAFEAGIITLADTGTDTGSIVIDGIDFGNDTGNYANDDECDDPRFEGSGMGASLDTHLMADATDCSAAYTAGTVTLVEETSDSGNFRINYGDDSSASAFDGVCDDPRFQGRGAAPELLDANLLTDASDCRTAHDAGTVTYEP